ncbi:P-loop containing nucleoside triphosphate hydrolase protein [Haematococcus lacustris]
MSHLASNITDTGEGLTKGSLVWVRSSSSVSWQAGELRGLEGSTAQVWLKATGVVATFEASAVLPANPTIQEAIPDLTHLSYLNEPGILCNLGRRYAEDAIYTFAGPVLIALNPCKALPLYTTEVANTYKAGARDVVQAASLAPHIYLVAANAFRRMAREHASQSLIVNGESGAGKTETTKKAMQYFATLAGGTGVEGQVLETNPILEAFGNAKTLRNHNSSRFGKLIQIHFNSSLHICGACIKTYLLEKSRVVKQLPGERSYHIFYQLVRGASPTMRAALGLPTHPRSFAFLAASGCTDIEGVDDAAEFQAVCEALGDVGIDPQLQASLFQLLAGVLWLGNLQFEADPTDLGNDATLLVEDTASQAVCGLLGVSHASLSAALTQRRIVTPSEVVTKLLNEEESKDCRDALAKALYAAAFDWIVSRINLKLDTGKKGSGLSISILDIYGFEQFTTNSFEQLCINYANERLQQQFTRHLFGLEQQEYEMEGIDWTKVEFVDNQECVDAVEQVPPRGLGVLSVLDAQCRFPKATDATFLTTLKEALSGHTRFSVSSRTPREFTILHYAGAVSYDSAGFLDKNKDTLNADLVELLVGADVSVSPLVPSLGRALKEEAEANIRRGGQTVGSRFAQQLRDLVQDLDTTGLHFVRCIKPNAALKPGWFEEELALHQLRCCGVLEVARIARAGFPTRYTHQMFAERYAILLPREQQAALQEAAGGMEGHQGNALTAVRTLTEVFGLTPSQYQIGRTKVFFRPGVLGFVEDKWAAMQAAALTLQAGWRMWTLRCSYLSQRAAALRVQSLWRMRCQRRLYADLLQQTHAATIIQSKWRGHRAQVRYQAMRESAVRLQLAWRRHCFAVRVERRVQERLRIERLKKLEQDKFESLRQQYGCDLDEVRAALATWVSARAVLSQQAQEKTDSQQPDLTTAELASRLLLAQHQHPTAEGATPHQQQPLPQHQQHTTAAATTGLADSVAALLSADATPTAASDLAAATAAVSPRISSPPAVEALPPAGWLARVPDLGLASSYSMQSAGFTTALELREASERLTLENLKLEKQLQLERSLKER